MFARSLLILMIALLCPHTAGAGAAADAFAAVKGIWLTEDRDGAVEFYVCGDNELCGKFAWLKPSPSNAVKADLDDKNPDPKLRNRQLCGMQFMGGFKPQNDGRFTGGWIYSPRHGAKFSSSIRTQTRDAIELRGYMLLPILGSSQTWTRAGNDITPCQPRSYDANIAGHPRRG